jgi:hypothetical protein
LESFLSLGQSIFLLAAANLKSVIGRNADVFYAVFTIHSAELLFQVFNALFMLVMRKCACVVIKRVRAALKSDFLFTASQLFTLSKVIEVVDIAKRTH